MDLCDDHALSPAAIIAAVDAADVVREDPSGGAWFPHRDVNSAVTHVEIRGPDFKGSLTGGTKTLFRLARANKRQIRLARAEAPIDALSVAAVEGLRADMLYAVAAA